MLYLPMAWFATWFDSPYYHTLYKNRDDKEASYFIDHLVKKLNIPHQGRVLDLACGRGRHSVYINSLGFTVTGADLSEQSIEYAKQFENDTLNFVVHDMRRPIAINYYTHIVNLFTSFGYFDNPRDNANVLESVYQALQPGGLFVLDYMNSRKVIDNLLRRETKLVDGISFNIYRSLEQGFIKKRIEFTDQGKDYKFTEKVQAFKQPDFEAMFAASGLKIVHTFGDYFLNEFNPRQSDRLIIVAQKPA